MKRFLLSCVIATMSLSGMTQNGDWTDEMKRLNKAHNEYRERKDWKRLVQTADMMEHLFMSQSDSARKAYYGRTELRPSVYYNAACYNTLAGNKQRGIKEFTRFVDAVVGKEEQNISHIDTDTDLDAIRNKKRFQEELARLKSWCDYPAKLKSAPSYKQGNLPKDFAFRYANPNDADLVRLRRHFNLDSVAGAGDEISKIKNLLHWVHEIVPHDGGSPWPDERNTIAMVELCRKENRGINCRMMAQMLAECYLAMGFKARYVTCLPKDLLSDCHVITAVYSCTLDKWLYVDPTFDAYVMDEAGNMLSIAEVREGIRKGQSLQINDYANWNHRSKQTVEHYLYYYMAKNLYYLSCIEESRFNAETWMEGRTYRYMVLVPEGDEEGEIKAVGSSLRVTDDAWFWQSPYAE